MAARFWTVGGAVTVGAGIWSMHFIGMLAFALPIPVSYDITLTAVSLLLPIFVSGVGLWESRRCGASRPRLLLGGVFVGLGIAAMHYTGMAAMKMEAPIGYQPALFGLSILIAVIGSVVSLWSGFRLRMETFFSAVVQKSGSALVAGAAISGKHYTAVDGAGFAPERGGTAKEQNINTFGPAATVRGVAF